MKKTISTFLIIILLFYFVCPPVLTHAATVKKEFTITQETYDKIMNSQADVTLYDKAQDKKVTQTMPFDVKDSTTKATTKNVVNFFNLIPAVVSMFMDLIIEKDTSKTTINVVENGKVVDKITGTTGAESTGKFDIQELVFDRYGLFNVNYINGDTANLGNNILAEQVAIWFFALRNVSIFMGLLVLVYIGIRMAVATLGEKKAQYQKMLLNWCFGMALIFLLPYIMAALNLISSALMQLLTSIADKVGLSFAPGEILENQILLSMERPGVKSSTRLVFETIILWVLTFYQLKFFMMYTKRMLSVAFLIVISPLISVLYPIDKIKDNKSQTLEIWIKEYATNILIQPLHAFLYLIFFVTAGEIIVSLPLLGIFFLTAVSRGEKIIRSVFRVRELTSIQELSQSLNFKDAKSRVGEVVGGLTKGAGR